MRSEQEVREYLEKMTRLWEEAADEHARTKNEGTGALAIVRAGFRDGLAWVLEVERDFSVKKN